MEIANLGSVKIHYYFFFFFICYKKIIFQNFFIKIKNLWIYSSSWSLLKKLPKSHNSFDSL